MTASLDPAAAHHLPALIRSGFAEIIGGRVSVLAEQVLSPEEFTQDCHDEEMVRSEIVREAMRDDKAHQEADFVIDLLDQVNTTLSF